jgi:hypothetical protein
MGMGMWLDNDMEAATTTTTTDTGAAGERKVTMTSIPTPTIETRPVGQCDTCGEYFHSLIAIGHKLDGQYGPTYWSAPTCSVECHDSFYAV